MVSRNEAWERLSESPDLLVIGGGITGAGLLLEASRRGLRAVLVERGDFASGTSSRSSKLVHGGLRYLREGKLRLTRESVHEREALLREAPGLVEPMPFLMPQYRGKGPGKTITQLGLALYDALAGRRTRQYLDAPETIAREPAIAAQGLLGAHAFFDATTDDARLVLRLLNEAERFGGAAMNYAQVSSFERDGHGRIRVALVEDVYQPRLQSVRAKAFVNATGVFADALRPASQSPKLRPLRGSHLLLRHERLPLTHAVAFAHPLDRRPVFAYPWLRMTLAGTTDLDHGEDLTNEPAIGREELQYLLHGLDAQFPSASITRSDIVSTFSGVRPVVASGKAAPSSESRDHVLLEEHGLITITGGKLTTFRPMALAALRAVERQLQRSIDRRPAPIFESAAPTQSAAHAGDGECIADLQTTWADLRYALRAECVVHLDDLLLRRTRLGLQLPDGAAEILPRVRRLCEEELHWNTDRWQEEKSAYHARIKAHYGVPA